VLGSLVEVERFGLAEDHWDTYAGKVLALSVADVAKAAKDHLLPGSLVWVVVGDRAQIEAGVRELNLGELRFLDADGNSVSK
jgi:zinc protease